MTADKPKKLSKRERDHAAMIAEAKRLAGMLADADPDGPGLLAPPKYIADERLAPALVVWRQLAPLLQKTGRLQDVDRTMFAALCYWQAEWFTAHEDILVRGYWFERKAVAGGSRPWINPSVSRRDMAYDRVLALAAKFGLTPLDRVALNKNKLHVGDDDGDLFDAAAAKAAPEVGDQPADDFADLLPN